MLKIPFQFVWNIQNFILSWKQSVFKQKRHVLRTFQFWPKSLYPGWPFFLLILGFFEMLKIPFQFVWNIQNFSSFMKTISLKQKRHVLRTFQFWPKSLYPGWPFFWLILGFFEMLKITLPIRLKHSKFYSFMKTISFEAKTACFEDFSILAKIAVSGVAIFMAYFRIFWSVENTLPIRLKHSKFYSLMKTISLKQNVMFWGLLNFGQNRCIWGGHFFCWF